MKNLEYKRLSAEDMDLWFPFRIASLKESPTAFLADPEKELSQGVDFFRSRIVEGGDDNVIFGCFEANKIVGAIGVVREFHLKSSHKAFIWGMYVAPEFRGLKIGGKLLDMAVQYAKERMKVKQLTLSVESTRESAKALYQSRGFKTWGQEKNAIHVDGKYFDEEYMALQLNSSDA